MTQERTRAAVSGYLAFDVLSALNTGSLYG
jgi:hypothetical protein